MTISIVCPTRNRAELWRSGWLLDSLAAQSRPPDELIIAIDHTEDDTLPTLAKKLERDRFPTPTRIITVEAPRPGPFPASGQPDNCLFHNATSDIILHVDDDIALPVDCLKRTEVYFETLPNIAVWYPMTFVDANRQPIKEGQDWRIEYAKKFRWKKGPCGLVAPHPAATGATGAIFAVLTSAIRAIGGHEVRCFGYHNQDTILGTRLSCFCSGGTFLAMSPATSALHFGPTWHVQNIANKQAFSTAYIQTRLQSIIANGGDKYWQTEFWKSAYSVAHTHTLTRRR